MSTTLNSQPQAAVPTGNCAEFELELSTAGTAPVERKIGYRVFLGGQQITQTDEQIPFTGAAEKIDPMPVVADFVKSVIPSYTLASIGTLAGATADFFLRYGHIDINTETCQQTNFINQDSGTITAIDGKLPGWYDLADLVNKPVVLSEKPGRINVAPGQRDWLCIYRHSGSIGLKVVGYNQDNQQVYYRTLTVSANKSVRVAPIGPGNAFFAFSSSIKYYDIEVHDSALPDEEISGLGFVGGPGINAVVWSARFIVTACSNTNPNNEIYFKEPLGGYSGFKLANSTNGANITSLRFREGRQCNDLINAGINRASIEALEQVTATFEQPYSEGLDRYINAFFASREHFWKYVKPNGSVAYRRVNLLDGSYQGLQDQSPLTTVQFTFEPAKEL